MVESSRSVSRSEQATDRPHLRAGASARRFVAQPAAYAVIAASALLFWASHRLVNHDLNLWVGAALALGIAAWLRRGHFPLPLAPRATPRPLTEARSTVRRPELAVAAVLIPIAFAQAADNQFRFVGVVAWTGAVAAWLSAWWPAPESTRRDRSRLNRSAVVVGLALLAIVAFGAYERFSQLPNTPAEPTSDHAEKLLDVTDLLNGERPIYFERNTGREPIQFYFTAFALIRVLDLPVNYETLKIGMAIADTLAIIAVFLFAAELAGREVGLFAALLHATAAWATIIGVFGLRPSLGPLTAGLALWAFLWYLRSGDRRAALLTGVLLGVGLYGYTAFRTVPLVVALSLIVMLLVDPRRRGMRWRGLGDAALMAATAVIVLIPLLRYITQYWDRFWYRTATRAGSTERAMSESGWDAFVERIRLFAENNWHALQMFHWRGDVAWVSFAPLRPALDYVTGAALFIGCAVIVRQLIQARDLRFATLVVAIPILLLSSTLALAFPHEVPSFSRSFLVAPLIFTIAATGLVALRRVIAGAFGTVASAAVVIVLVVIGYRENSALVREYDQYYRATVANSVEIAQTVIAAEGALGVERGDVFLLGAAHWLDHRNVAFELGDIDWGERNHVVPGAPIPSIAVAGGALFIFHPADQARLEQLWRRWPEGVAVIVQSTRPGKQFGLFLVNVDREGVTELNGLPLLSTPSPCQPGPTSALCLRP